MSKQGEQYVNKVAHFFSNLGFKTEIEKTVAGARGVHKIDILVTGKLLNFEVYWAVECKDWKRRVPKEKIHAFHSIIMDIGSDRGFLMSELGFQAGAIRSAQFSNLTLTSLQDLQEQTSEQFAQDELWSLYKRMLLIIRELENEPSRIYLAGPPTGCLYHNPAIENNVGNLKLLCQKILSSLLFNFQSSNLIRFKVVSFSNEINQLIETSTSALTIALTLLENLRNEYPDEWYKLKTENRSIDNNII